MLAISALSSQVFAADSKTVGENFDSEKNSYLGIEAGYVKLQNTDGGVAIGRIFAGYKINENVGIELGAYRTANTDYYFLGATIRAYAYGYDTSLILRPNVSTGMNGLFLRLGGHYDRVNYDCYGYCYNAAQWGSGALAGIGYDGKFSDSVSGRISYTYYDNVAGTSDSVNTVSLGLMYNY